MAAKGCNWPATTWWVRRQHIWGRGIHHEGNRGVRDRVVELGHPDFLSISAIMPDNVYAPAPLVNPVCQTITAVWCYQACSRPTTDRYSVLKDHLLSMYKNLSYVIFPVLRLDCSTLCALPIKADLDRHHTVKSEQDNPDRGLMSDCSIQWYVLYMWPEATYTPGISRVE